MGFWRLRVSESYGFPVSERSSSAVVDVYSGSCVLMYVDG